MGCDGGTIPRRDELVKLKKKPEQKDKDSELAYKWRHCALTQEKLVQPIVACGLGKLYNKQAIIESLLAKSLPESASHIRNLKDVKDLKLSPNPAYKTETDKNSPYICPIIGLEMTGRFRFICLWSCGCVFSERALKEIKTKQCVMCQKQFEDSDVVVLNGNEEDLILMSTRMADRKNKLKEKKKDKKEKKVASSTSVNNAETTTTGGNKSSITSTGEQNSASTSTIKVEPNSSSSISASTSAIKIEPNSSSNVTVKPVKRGADLKPIHDPLFKKAKGDYSVSKDPNATEVFKSIFTSHQTEKKQDRAHWITYNPFYN